MFAHFYIMEKDEQLKCDVWIPVHAECVPDEIAEFGGTWVATADKYIQRWLNGDPAFPSLAGVNRIRVEIYEQGEVKADVSQVNG